MSGPFETERAAWAAVAGFYETSSTRHQTSFLVLSEVLEGAGVELGAYDRVVLEWLANYEPTVVAVVAGWIWRASRREE